MQKVAIPTNDSYNNVFIGISGYFMGNNDIELKSLFAKAVQFFSCPLLYFPNNLFISIHFGLSLRTKIILGFKREMKNITLQSMDIVGFGFSILTKYAKGESWEEKRSRLNMDVDVDIGVDMLKIPPKRWKTYFSFEWAVKE